MSHPQLDNLARIGKLKAEPAAESELVGLSVPAPDACMTRRARSWASKAGSTGKTRERPGGAGFGILDV